MLPKILSQSFVSQPSKSTTVCRFPKMAATLNKSIADSPNFFYSSAVRTNFEIRRRILFSPLVARGLKLRLAPIREERTICYLKNRSDGESLGKDTQIPTIPHSGFEIGEPSLDEKARILLYGEIIATVVILGVLYFRFLPFLMTYFDMKGWLLWTGIGLCSAVVAVTLTAVAMSFFNRMPKRENDALVDSLPFIASSSTCTACLLGVTGVLASILEETVFIGFLMVFLTKRLPTPVSVLISAAVFAGAHFSHGTFPRNFVLGTVLGYSYAQTRNLLTPIMIHALWNSIVLCRLTYLKLKGIDIKAMLEAS